MIKDTNTKFKKIAVLMGGLSSEREVSLSSGKEIYKSLKRLGYDAIEIDVNYDIAKVLKELAPDAAFNALHGTYGEDGCIQGLLEILRIPYTHSGVLASSLAMDKGRTKQFLKSYGILTPHGQVMDREQVIDNLSKFEPPYVIKPVSEGSSVGINIVLNKNQVPNNIFNAKKFLVEEYIEGLELSAAVTDEKPLGVIELEPHSGFYDYKNKYSDGMTTHHMPARINKEIYDKALDIAFQAHNLIGCKNISRSDFRYNPATNKLYLLEINTHPGMTPLSLVPEIANYCGISFDQLINYILENATCEKF